MDQWAMIWYCEGDLRVEVFETEAEARQEYQEKCETGWAAGLYRLCEQSPKAEKGELW